MSFEYGFDQITFIPEILPFWPWKGLGAHSQYYPKRRAAMAPYERQYQEPFARAAWNTATSKKAVIGGIIHEHKLEKTVIETRGVCRIAEAHAGIGTFNISEGRAGVTGPETSTRFFFPLDPRVTEEDADGATIWYPNETNTGWLFAHCDKDYHLDFEYHLTSALNSVFAREKDAVHDVADSALYSLFLSNTSEKRHEWGRKTRVLDNLRKFHAQAELEILKEHKSRPIGHYHRNPYDAHLHEPILRALRKVETLWAEDNEQAIHWRDLKPVVARIKDRVRILYPYKTRWELAAEAEAEE